MALNLSTLAGKLAKTDVEFMGHTAVITYDPTFLTQANVSKMQAGGDEEFVEFFTGLVKNWDVTKGNRKVPLTKTGLKDVPILFLRAVYQTIQRHGGEADVEEGKASNGG